MEIQRAHKDDHIILTNITYKGKAHWGYSKSQLEKWQADLTVSPGYIIENDTFKLIFDDKIVGYYAVLQVEDNVLKLDNMFVLPEYIGKGFGKFLLLDAINRAKNNKVKKMILDAEPKAEDFYKKFGFETYTLLESSIKNRFLPQMMLSLE